MKQYYYYPHSHTVTPRKSKAVVSIENLFYNIIIHEIIQQKLPYRIHYYDKTWPNNAEFLKVTVGNILILFYPDHIITRHEFFENQDQHILQYSEYTDIKEFVEKCGVINYGRLHK